MRIETIAPDLRRAADAIAARGGLVGRPLELLDETASTNDCAKRGAKNGAPHGAVWITEAQTAGRGRQGRVWHSPRGENLLFSVLLRIPCAPARVPLLSLVAGLAVRDAVARALGDDDAVFVKWPNDVLVRRPGDTHLRKVAGVLVESALAGARVEYVVVGIGINVHMRALPDEVEATATSIALERDVRPKASTPELDRAEVLADVLAGLDRDAEHVAHMGLGLIHGRLVRRDALAGAAVEGDGNLRGTACGIDTDGRLLVRRDDGVVVRVSSGEVVRGATP
jgi:BirA family biotin operon repressor/biotin-[acetyl-CoA-carboxylase] ligase